MKFSAPLSCFALLLIVGSAPGQRSKELPYSYEVSVVAADGDRGKSLQRGQVAKLIIDWKIKPGYYAFPLTVRTGMQKPGEMFTLSFPKIPEGLKPLWPVEESPLPEKSDKIENGQTITLFKHKEDFRWTQDVLVLPEATPGKLELPLKISGQVCDIPNKVGCFRVLKSETPIFNVSSATPAPLSESVKERLKVTSPEPKIVLIDGQIPVPDIKEPKTLANTPGRESAGDQGDGIFAPISAPVDQYQQTMEEIGKSFKLREGLMLADQSGDLWGFILAGIFWGAVSLVTPCVFPMIPITVSFFLKQSEKEHHKPLAMALVYSGTIVVVLTLAAAFLLSVFRWLSVNPIMNYALGLLFIYFALSLFGMYEIELPSGLARFTSAREGQGGFIGTMFMALTFTIISFACVAPFLGGFGGTAAGVARPWWHNILGGLAFSTTFAAPFFFLALFPTLLRKMPKSGSWLNSVKVVMGFLELAAALKFFRSAELVMTGSNTWLFTFDFVLGIYIALCFLAGLYLLGFYRLPHDSPIEHVGVPRMVLAGLFIGLGFYMLPALNKQGDPPQSQRPNGTIYAWVDSFLLPDGRKIKDMPHTGDLKAALTQAREFKQKTGLIKRVFVDFTGVNCTNCNLNEQNVFPKPHIAKLFKPYTIVKLYTDTVPDEYFSPELLAQSNNVTHTQGEYAEVNLLFQRKFFQDEKLPLYTILEPLDDGHVEIVNIYPEGRINNEAAFATFLQKPK